LPDRVNFLAQKIGKMAISKNTEIFKFTLNGSTPCYFLPIRHIMIFSKTTNFGGGVTLMRTYASQWSKHPHYSVRV
jgi:hypothetical protein